MSETDGGGITSVLRPISAELERVRFLIGAELFGEGGRAGELARDHLGTGGKLIRAGLVLLSFKAAGGVEVSEKVLKAAAMVEILHAATLVHDDVLDEGEKRRGMVTVNKLHGNEAAVLLGDYVLARVLRLALSLGEPLSERLADVTEKICRGELEQVMTRGEWELSEESYLGIIGGKSASLFACCCEIGGRLAESGVDLLESLRKYGYELGIAFQISDDLLDIYGEEDRVAKSVGRDMAKGKPTLAMIDHLRKVSAGDRDEFIKLISSDLNEDRVRVRALLENSGSVGYAKERCGEHVASAVASLEAVGEREAANTLVNLAKAVIKRAQ